MLVETRVLLKFEHFEMLGPYLAWPGWLVISPFPPIQIP
ncbi:unnamed protein product [Musa hybrid cultivar]